MRGAASVFEDPVPHTEPANSEEGVRFSIRRWSAWAPGLEDAESWRRWARGDAAIRGEGDPRVAAMPPLLRRRAGRFGRMALETLYACSAGSDTAPIVFCSRHGDMWRVVQILEALSRREAVSPTAFSLSVHNAVGGLFTIAAGNSRPVTALSAGADTAACGAVEACGLLAAGAPEVLLTVCDEPLPPAYAQFREEAEVPYAWTWRIAPPGGTHLSVRRAAPRGGEETRAPAGLEALRFFLAEESERVMAFGGRAWRWARHA
jgi:hypothetical protein